MILEPKQTTVAYRCPDCGSAVFSAVGLFTLSGDLVKLKCGCKKSEMTALRQNDGKIQLTVPCALCGKSHCFTVAESLFFRKELFVLNCPLTDLTVCAMGEMNEVKAEMARNELELLDLMEKCGIENMNPFQNKEEVLPDPSIREIVMFVINDLDAEGKIVCRCNAEDTERSYDAKIQEDGILVSCSKCGAKRLIPTDSNIAAHDFLNADELRLE